MTKEEKFLYDIEYDVSSAFKKRQGVNLDASERNALNAEMGRQGFFRQEITRIMKTAEARNTINELKALRRPPNFVGSQDTPIGQYDQIHMMLRDAQKEAEERAFNMLTQVRLLLSSVFGLSRLTQLAHSKVLDLSQLIVIKQNGVH